MPALAPNNITTTLGAALSNAATALQVATGYGATLKAALLSGPRYDGSNAIGTGQFVYLTITEGGTQEIVRVDGPWHNTGTADVLGGAGGGTLTRGVDGTTAGTFTTAATVEVRDARALYSAMSQPDATETRSALQTVNDGMLKLVEGVRAVSLPGAPTTGAVAGEAKPFVHGLAGNPNAAHLAFAEYAADAPALIEISRHSHNVAIATVGVNTITTNGLTVNQITAPAVQQPLTTVADKLTSMPRARFTSAATVSTGTGWNANSTGSVASVYRSSVAGAGGFAGSWWFGFPSGQALLSTARLFIGFSSAGSVTTMATTGDPSGTAQHCVGLYFDAADTNFQLLTMSGVTASKTTTALTTTRSKNTQSDYAGKLYRLAISCGIGDGTNAGDVYLSLWEYATGSAGFLPTLLFRGQLTGNLPSSMATMYPCFILGNGSTATAQMIEFVRGVYTSR